MKCYTYNKGELKPQHRSGMLRFIKLKCDYCNKEYKFVSIGNFIDKPKADS